jgi:hypothetical protein
MSSASSIKDIYLSENNIDFLYRDVSEQVAQKVNYNMNSSSKYKKTFNGMMEKVYQNVDSNTSNNLASLNRYTVQKITSYFIDQFSKKQKSQMTNNSEMSGMYQTGPNNFIDRPARAIVGNSSEDVISNRFDTLQHERQSLNEMQLPKNPNPQGFKPKSVHELEPINTEDTEKRYKSLLASRGDLSIANNPFNSTQQNTPLLNMDTANQTAPRNVSIEIVETPQMNQKNQNNQKNHNNHNKMVEKQEEYNILPFTLNNDFTDQTSNLGQPLYFNSDQLNEITPENVGNRFQDLQKIRNQEINDFLQYQKSVENKTTVHTPQEIREGFVGDVPVNNKFSSDKVVSDFLGDRMAVEHSNTVRNPAEINRTDIFSKLSIDERDRYSNEKKHNSSFDTSLDVGNPIYDFLLSQIRDSKREYHDVANYFVVSSEDRNWENNAENRYNFLVNFRPSDTQTGVGIDQLYRNVVSVEVIKVIFPHDRLAVPFDNRIYLDLQSYPFLVMDIDELDGVFKGSNNTVNEAFALLLFDKAYDSEVLTCDQIKNCLTRPSPEDNIHKRFDRQFKRGFMSFCPFLFEKKKYPNTPLASLNRMTIRFYRPDGQLISVDQDHLEIKNITAVALGDTETDLELKNTTGFPRSVSGQYIKIETKTFFSNRVFRVGDLIKIRNYKLKTSVIGDEKHAFAEFINRPQGHIIINLEREISQTGDSLTDNEGYISSLYIAPAGEIDKNWGRLNTSTYHDTTADPADMYLIDDDPTKPSYGQLINSSMQVHVTFKIVSREDRTTAVIKPVNV